MRVCAGAGGRRDVECPRCLIVSRNAQCYHRRGEWLTLAAADAPAVQCVLLGNKCDAVSNRQVSYDTAEAFVQLQRSTTGQGTALHVFRSLDVAISYNIIFLYNYNIILLYYIYVDAHYASSHRVPKP